MLILYFNPFDPLTAAPSLADLQGVTLMSLGPAPARSITLTVLPGFFRLP
ncbi:hypothetical protein J2W49_002087 [Hydrogenophaga palleronii]|uniref:Uncharacterized protein n=1 Tax=Hydrogenophaga palleronii TaxID=65655 RepID=A0ABU1WM46_9BURK|nr:hypothetical protein [Hydrogenophaga palleronii]MDR7150129.1 hypothetical protein [Hydrogenophaga palleronii]